MEEQRQDGEPIVYVGGLGEPPKRHVWPFLLLGLLPVAAAIAIAVFWGPIRSLGRTAGQTVAPYSLSLDDASWSSDDLIATVPVDLILTVSNADQRTLNGLTLRFVKLDSAWQILGASSPNAEGAVNGTSIYFSNRLPPNDSVKLTVTMRPSKATNADIGISLSPGRDTGRAHVALPGGSVTSAFLITAKVRNPTEADAYARLTAIYDPLPNKGQISTWQIHVANVGPITINHIRLSVPAEELSAFQFLTLPAQGSAMADGHTFEFDLSLPPGGQTILFLGVVPQASGHFQIPIQVYLEKSLQPLIAADGGPPITVDVTVS